ncbi:MAG: 23S rRNA (adenine(2503)-C(2))-methyltransferase RlmN [Acidobacteria bacterium]|nr:MAG: 23S rRNA (adenine(2503)-C(2))-methyltransferase RlmN [Acidobacteriota bacterium]
MTRRELEDFSRAAGEPPYRGRQLYHGLYARRVKDFAALTDLDRKFRQSLAERSIIRYPAIERAFASGDRSVRYLLSLEDGEKVEAVFMPDEARTTLCISSQAGCAVDCKFCFTGLMGLKRNLTAGEMAGQVLTLLEASGLRGRVNVVFMGMGEPLLNYAEVVKAVEILADPEGVAIPARRITVSTAGIVPRIYDLARERVRPRLAVSLNASTDEERTALMPINRKYPLSELTKACREYRLPARERLTFEYVLLAGVNDSDDDARRVAELVEGIRAKINLIPYNSGPDLPYRAPPLERVLAFQQILRERRVPAFIRISRGRDVMGACGQLSLAGNQEAEVRS